MFRNYLNLALRNLRKNKLYAVINIIGLASGMAAAIVIGLWISDEWMFNKQFDNYPRIAQVWQHVSNNGHIGSGNTQPFPLAAELRNKYGSDFRYVSLASWNQTHIITVKDNALSGNGIYAEPDFTKLFSLRMLKGSNNTEDLNTILLSASFARSCFGNEDPINKTLLLDNNENMVVTGVYEDMPANSSFANVAYILPWAKYAKGEKLTEWDNPWRPNSFQVFVQVADKVDMAALSAKIKDVKLNNIQPDERSLHPQLFLHPMSRWHLYSEFKNGVNTGGLIQYIWLLGISGLFILMLACINFMNLTTARSEKRAKEVGIRKSIGSLRYQLVTQFFSESLLMVLIAFAVSLIIVQLSLPFFNTIADKKIAIFWTSPIFWFACTGFAAFTAFIAGSYPAFYLSSFRPVKVLKGTFRVGKAATIPRKMLVILQFSTSVILIISTTIVYRQVQYANNRPIGYDRHGLVMLPMYTSFIHQHFDAVKNELIASGAVSNMAESWSPVTSVWATNSGFNWEGKDPELALDFPNDGISYDFGKTVGWEFIAGRDFSRSFASDSAAFVINETAAKFMGIKDPVGKIITWDGAPYQIIGVIRDVIAESPYTAVRPSLYHLNTGNGTRMIVKINPAVSMAEALRQMERIFKKNNPSHPFDYEFTDQEYAKKFGEEQRFGRLTGIFSLLAIFISCIGLFGMASFMAEQRTKEIGVRKVLGATTFNLWQLLSTDFVKLVLISLPVAFCVAYYFMSGWLEQYEYRVDFSWWIFPLAGVATLLITILTVSYQSFRAALANPVKSLRNE